MATASASAPHHHRSTLSQANKPFKARHATKGSLKQLAKGRLEKLSSSSKQKPGAATLSTNQKAARKNHAKQLKANKAQTHQAAQRVFSGPDPAPRLISILALSEDIRPLEDVVASFHATADLDAPPEPNSGSVTFRWPSSASKDLLRFILIPHGTSLPRVLSTVSASDFLICSLSAHEECTPWGESTLRALQSLGGPILGTLAAACHLGSLSEPKKVNRTRESLASFLRYFFPDTLLLNRVVSLEAPQEVSGAVRSILSKFPVAPLSARHPRWRDGRGRLVAEVVKWQDDTLQVTGHVRGGRFSADRLVHIPLLGDYRLSKITMGEGQEEKLASARTADADDLTSENCPLEGDELMAEQTWPTEEEIASAPANQKPVGTNRNPRRVPAGTSDYQAAWLVGDDDDLEGDEDESGKDDESSQGTSHCGEQNHNGDEKMEGLHVDWSSAAPSQGVPFTDLWEEADQADLAKYQENRRRERDRAREDEEFPDEIDTPMDIPARQRFARYRGMKSLRTSEWDPYENLPIEYGKLFRFEGWKAMSKRLAHKANEEDLGAGPGMRVTLHLEHVSRTDFDSIPSSLPLIVFSLLQHEHKYSVMHFSTQRDTEFEGDVKSKDPLVICAGFRFYSIRPIWSQPSVRATNNVHKFERYLRPGRVNIGTVYMPVTFGSTTPIVLLKDGSEGQIEFVGGGTLVASEPQRIIAKRIILSGHPYKIHRKTATIRYMFFNREDIEYFKPVELRTKKGRTGHIKEPLGTHGYFKAGFDGQIDQMDTICMALYKRCFPRWAVGWAGPQTLECNKDGAMDLDHE